MIQKKVSCWGKVTAVHFSSQNFVPSPPEFFIPPHTSILRQVSHAFIQAGRRILFFLFWNLQVIFRLAFFLTTVPILIGDVPILSDHVLIVSGNVRILSDQALILSGHVLILSCHSQVVILSGHLEIPTDYPLQYKWYRDLLGLEAKEHNSFV